VPRALAYIDDVIVGTAHPDPGGSGLSGSGSVTTLDIVTQHFLDVSETLEAFRKHKLCTNGLKVDLFKRRIKFVGQILEDGQRRAAPSKVAAIEKWHWSDITSVHRMRSFLGLAQHYAQFMPDFARHAYPLTEQLKGCAKKRIVWTDIMILGFDQIKKDLLSNVVLDIPDPSKSFVLESDASDYAVGGY
jgi:hypothetical protein